MRSTFPALAFLLLVDLIVFTTVLQPIMTRLMYRYYEITLIFDRIDMYMR